MRSTKRVVRCEPRGFLKFSGSTPLHRCITANSWFGLWSSRMQSGLVITNFGVSEYKANIMADQTCVQVASNYRQ